MKFFIWQNDQHHGPFEEETIRNMISDGSINQETLVSLESGESGWVPAKEMFLPEPRQEERSSQISTSAEETSPPYSPDQDDGSRLLIRLLSGEELKIKAIRLYDEVILAEIAAKRSKALKNLQGVSTGLGAIGSLGWVVAASLVIGAVEGALSASASEEAKNLLGQLIALERKLRSKGIFSFIGKIENVEMPNVGLWRVRYNRKGKVQAGKNFWGEMQFETRDIQSALIHSGDDFIEVQRDDGSISFVRWTTVATYSHQTAK